MPFINEIPSAEDIEKYGLPFKKDLDLDISLRRQWTVDRERNFYLYVGGLTGNPAYEGIVYYCFYLYLNGTKFIVELDVDRNRTPSTFEDNPYIVEWENRCRSKPCPAIRQGILRSYPILPGKVLMCRNPYWIIIRSMNLSVFLKKQ